MKNSNVLIENSYINLSEKPIFKNFFELFNNSEKFNTWSDGIIIVRVDDCNFTVETVRKDPQVFSSFAPYPISYEYPTFAPVRIVDYKTAIQYFNLGFPIKSENRLDEFVDENYIEQSKEVHGNIFSIKDNKIYINFKHRYNGNCMKDLEENLKFEFGITITDDEKNGDWLVFQKELF